MESNRYEKASVALPILTLVLSSILFIATFFLDFSDDVVGHDNPILGVIQVAEKLDLVTFARVLVFLAAFAAGKQIRNAMHPSGSHRSIEALDEQVGYLQAKIERIENMPRPITEERPPRL